MHEWESKCNGCSIVRKYDASLNSCPVIDCADSTVAELGYTHLHDNCVAADTSYAFEWAANFDTPAAFASALAEMCRRSSFLRAGSAPLSSAAVRVAHPALVIRLQ